MGDKHHESIVAGFVKSVISLSPALISRRLEQIRTTGHYFRETDEVSANKKGFHCIYKCSECG
jgi:hypothetical protein